MRAWTPARVALVTIALAAAPSWGAAEPESSSSQTRPWGDVSELTRDGWSAQLAGGRQVRLDRAALLAQLEQGTPRDASGAIIALPRPDGGFVRLWVAPVPLLAPELAARFPEIRAFRGRGVDDPGMLAALDLTPSGLHALVLAPEGTWLVDPLGDGRTDEHVAYFKRDLPAGDDERSTCGVTSAGATDAVEIDAGRPVPTRSAAGSILRTYRAAVAATAEYTQYHGGSVALGLAAVATVLNRVSAVYERDLAIRLQLVANNDLLIFTDALADPYSNGDEFAMLDQNQTTLDLLIGASNYDIGHVLGAGSGGVAEIAKVCQPAKARGVSQRTVPVGDAFAFDYVAHEMGHQFGASHTFNGTSAACGPSRDPGSAVETASGSTIMAYAGICGAEDLQTHNDDYFNTVSQAAILGYVSLGGACAASAVTGNSLPVLSAPASLTIPAATPFALTATGSDADGDALTYAWEQTDVGAASPPQGDDGTRPLFRSFPPVASPTRTFPRLQDLLANTSTLGETLPSQSRTLHFTVTARDNRPLGGAHASAATALTVHAASGPFMVTSPNTAVIWQGGSTQSVSWQVAGTQAAPVNVASVRILLSWDGGQTFPTVLEASTPNDGSELVVVPDVSVDVTTARIKVEAVGNVFFDVSNVDFTVAVAPNFLIGCAPAALNLGPGGQVSALCTLEGLSGFAGTVALDCVGGMVPGLACAFSPASVLVTSGSAVNVGLTFSATTAVAPSTYAFRVRGSGGGLSRLSNDMTATLSRQLSTHTANTNAAIPDNNATGIVRSQLVSFSQAVTSVAVHADVSHTFRGDLEVTLIGPDGTSVRLHNRTGGSADDLKTTYNVSTRSYQPLSAFNGKRTDGLWSLEVRDLAAADVGTLNSWTLAFNGYASAAPAAIVPDNNVTGVVSTISIPATGTVQSVRVRVDVSHPSRGQLEVRLTRPGGTSVLLHNLTGGAADDLATVYPDLTAPAQSLNAFVGKAAGGTWELRVRDLAATGTGTLNSWELDLR